ncbi:hypothetical protein LTR62_000338 [Meristemomyces frigidus]|uniref:tRNA/rRNA methyltransferase SpoU type domain-containing protein n=1 Tax=Meristemomyces frigidus TaxID=1508187 RepID=A0AAN7YNV5_9PEZI|nr:hypothetical protein LTR62_000338 [Meristemomyces frigidus]
MATTTFRRLLQYVPAEDRSIAVRAAVEDAKKGSTADITAALDLLAEHTDEAAKQSLILHLHELLDCGKLPAGLGLSGELLAELVQYAAAGLHDAVYHMQRMPGAVLEVQMEQLRLEFGKSTQPPDLTLSSYQSVRIISLLHFVKSMNRADVSKTVYDQVFAAALVLIGSADRTIATAARDVLARQITSTLVEGSDTGTMLWPCLQSLLSNSNDPFYQALAFSLWLCCASANYSALSTWMCPAYWCILQEGLKLGDAERRKQCLAILRQSVLWNAGYSSPCSIAGVENMMARDFRLLVEQYERFCTVFETILLGRYLNQVIATEPDLDLLSSPISLVGRQWLYVLLDASLNSKIQDSNRRFIGNWIMHVQLRPDDISKGGTRAEIQSKDASAFMRLFRNSFLPWATQGSLFTSTLKREHDVLRCKHGIRLAEYIEVLLTDTDYCSTILDIILDLILNRRGGNFAYASVYLLQGVAHASEKVQPAGFSQQALLKIAEISTWAALPEVARDFVYVRCLKLCNDARPKGVAVEGDVSPAGLARAAAQWDKLRAELTTYTQADRSPRLAAMWSAAPSRRDQLERAGLGECAQLRQILDAKDSLHPETVLAQIEQIWNDAEYLEYPKELIMQLPYLILHSNLLALADASGDIKSMLAKRIGDLRKLSETRVYLFPPLLCAIRNIGLMGHYLSDLIDLEDLILQYAERLPEPTIDMRLEDATAVLLQSVEPGMTARFSYEYYFGYREMYGVAALLDLVSRLGNSSCTLPIFEQLLHRWAKQKAPVPSVSPWKRALQLQLMLLTCEQTLSQINAVEALQKLHYVLSIEPLPRYRYLLSWIIARIYLKERTLRPRILIELSTKDHHSNPKYLASLLKIGVMVAKTEETDAEFAFKLACAFVPLAASSKVVIRHEAQWQMPRLMDYAKERSWSQITDNAAFVALDEYIRSLERFELPPLERQLDRFDPAKDHTMTNLVEGAWYGLDSTEVALCSREDFLTLWEDDVKQGHSWPAPCIPLGEPISVLAQQQEPEPLSETVDGSKQKSPPPATGEPRALQTKGTAYLASGLSHSTSPSPQRRKELIVIASLVDNPHNLGGLSRVAEIFGASELHLQNANVTSNKDFTAVSVSSHNHLPIHQLSASAIMEYLAVKKSEGWSVVGIEQTDRSLLLGSEECRLPEKIVLVLGSEREGIPAVVLGSCDFLVEIRQEGVTRSLNVQTAAAVVLFEFGRQHSKEG